MEAALEASSVSKSFLVTKTFRSLFLHPLKKDWVHALRGVDLTVRSGELFGLLGPNGAGKTTLLKVFGTLVLPDKGIIRVGGVDVVQDERKIRTFLGYVMSEERSFYWRLTGRQNLSFFATLYELSGRSRERRIDELLELLELSYAADRPFRTYSTGMKQRLAIARGLLSNPDVVLMDEPTRSLDPGGAIAVRRLVRERIVEEQGKTVLFATHLLEEAESLCDRLAIIHKGRIIASGDIHEIRELIPRPKQYKAIWEKPDFSAARRLSEIDGVAEVRPISSRTESDEESTSAMIRLEPSASPASVLRQCVEAGVELSGWEKVEIPLTEIFEQLTSEHDKSTDEETNF